MDEPAEPTRAAGTAPASQTVASNAVTALGGQVAVYALSFLTSIVVTRSLEATGRGQYYIPIAAATVCVAVANIGLESANNVLTSKREYTLEQLSRNASLVAIMVGPTAVGVMLLLFTALGSSGFRSISTVDYVIAVSTVPFSLHLLWLANLFLLSRQLARSQVALVAGAVVYLLGATLLAVLGALGVTQALLLYAASILVSWLGHLWWVERVAPVWPALDRELLKRVVSFGLRFHVGLVLSYLLLRFDVFLVNVYLGNREVGIYSVAVLFAEFVWLLTGPLVHATIPFQTGETMTNSGRLAFKGARFNFALGLMVSAFLAMTLWVVLPLLYGQAFSDAYAPLLLLMPGICAMAAARSLGLLITREERPGRYAAITAAAFALNVALNVLLLPEMGIAGASAASSIAYIALCAALVQWGLRLSELSAREAMLPQRGDWTSLKDALATVPGRIRRTSHKAGKA